jgi:hypothetical protein
MRNSSSLEILSTLQANLARSKDLKVLNESRRPYGGGGWGEWVDYTIAPHRRLSQEKLTAAFLSLVPSGHRFEFGWWRTDDPRFAQMSIKYHIGAVEIQRKLWFRTEDPPPHLKVKSTRTEGPNLAFDETERVDMYRSIGIAVFPSVAAWEKLQI